MPREFQYKSGTSGGWADGINSAGNGRGWSRLAGPALVRPDRDGAGLHAQHRRPLRDLDGPRTDPPRAAPHGFRHRVPDGRLARALLRRARLPAVLADRPRKPQEHHRGLPRPVVGDDGVLRPLEELRAAPDCPHRRRRRRGRRHAGRELDHLGLFSRGEAADGAHRVFAGRADRRVARRGYRGHDQRRLQLAHRVPGARRARHRRRAPDLPDRARAPARAARPQGRRPRRRVVPREHALPLDPEIGRTRDGRQRPDGALGLGPHVVDAHLPDPQLRNDAGRGGRDHGPDPPDRRRTRDASDRLVDGAALDAGPAPDRQHDGRVHRHFHDRLGGHLLDGQPRACERALLDLHPFDLFLHRSVLRPPHQPLRAAHARAVLRGDAVPRERRQPDRRAADGGVPERRVRAGWRFRTAHRCASRCCASSRPGSGPPGTTSSRPAGSSRTRSARRGSAWPRAGRAAPAPREGPRARARSVATGRRPRG